MEKFKKMKKKNIIVVAGGIAIIGVFVASNIWSYHLGLNDAAVAMIDYIKEADPDTYWKCVNYTIGK